MAEQLTHLEVTTEQARRDAVSKVQEAEPEASQGIGKRVCLLPSSKESDIEAALEAVTQNLCSKH
jgi:hypothetical protein